jgi:hypothetical protein
MSDDYLSQRASRIDIHVQLLLVGVERVLDITPGVLAERLM